MNGDLIQSVNGRSVSSAEKALEIYTMLREAKSLTIELVRQGAPLTIAIANVEYPGSAGDP
jgi:type II secretory pathway component PulC